MSIEEVKETKLLLVGGTGDGKSSLGNFILKSNKFDVTDDVNSKTQKTSGFYGEGNRSDVFVIDTPGFYDSEGIEKDNEHIEQMVEYIKNIKGVQAIVIVLNYNNKKLSSAVKTMIEIICNIFPIYDFWKHVCVVWTMCYNYTPLKKLKQTINTKKKLYYKELSQFAREITGDLKIVLPMYCVDSVPDEDFDNSRSENEIKDLLTWVHCLKPISVDKITVTDATYKCITKEEKENTTIKEIKDDFIKLEIDLSRREKKIGYRGEVSYSDWEKVNSKIVLKPIPDQYSNTSKEGFEKLLNEVGDSMFGFIMDGVVTQDRLMY
ncbi:AIG1 family protein, putative [Entamoeba histolytica HM-1:IMSS-B]|uniref:AIG1 family protein n=5 Tax=Entamoeba histolytica TaxID=5759 RepID=A0A2Z6BDK4_ENTH1|nr:AIG1 family protein, putative [Entamoeba histolytica HM-1:IMSS-B]ENY62303.1 AIG1 family protein, putative [Entamoeba histolytica HM-1:IMSS-A]BBD14083.1 AIG1 family protein [Entamoeba histolytica HM-1:IMSS]BBD14086.1 AIG1 family protein [Entamoeba histolytica KU50]GAT99175.1 AIG1 family protein putative [Entamoeba histolytica]